MFSARCDESVLADGLAQIKPVWAQDARADTCLDLEGEALTFFSC